MQLTGERNADRNEVRVDSNEGILLTLQKEKSPV